MNLDDLKKTVKRIPHFSYLVDSVDSDIEIFCIKFPNIGILEQNQKI